VLFRLLFFYCVLLLELCCVVTFAAVVLCCVFADRHDAREAGIWGVTETTTATDSYNRPSNKISRVDYGFCTNFIVYARDFEVREEKKVPRHVRTRKNDSFHFHFVFFRSRDVNLERTT
jgi:hypothetical protein